MIRIGVAKSFDNFSPERIKSDEVYEAGVNFENRFRPWVREERAHKSELEFQNSTSSHMNENTFKKLRRRRRKLQNARIIGGGTATRNRYLYMASLTYERAHTCGGSLIADDIVLSAAHCSEAFDSIDIGRHNVKDPNEDFERYNVEKFKIHPEYVDKNRPGAAFNNDYMIIKLYGWSKKPTIRLNSEPATPNNNQDLHVMGWGVVDATNKLPSEVLKEVSVNAISNSECEGRSGFIGGRKISLMGRITDNMLCAQDLDEDACQGDSGGPLIVKGPLPRQDVQVGVVSWGLGCAHQVFPGVYSRMSSQIVWIKQTVCEWSESPPDEFGCSKSDEPNKDGSGDSGKRAVTVDIVLDRFPKETGWLIRTKEGKSIAYIPIGGYKDVKDSEKHIVATLHLSTNQHYEFIMLDAYGDGLKFDGGMYKLWLGDTPYIGQLLAEGSTFGRSKHHPFYVPKEQPKTPAPVPAATAPTGNNPTLPVNNPSPNAPKPTSVPTFSTAAPSEYSQHITIAIKLDNYPEEVGWAVSSAKNYIIASKPIGSYKRKNKLIIEKVRIPEKYLESSANIMFAILDNGQDGLCCNKGQGLFQVFIGDIEDGNLVVKGSKFQRLQHFDINLYTQSSYSIATGKVLQPTISFESRSAPTKSDPTVTASERSASAALGTHASQLRAILFLVVSSVVVLL